MATKKVFLLFLVIFLAKVESASLIERSYDYVVNLGRNVGPTFMSFVDCLVEDDVWLCAKEKAGKMLDSWDENVQKQRRSWQDDADAEIKESGRNLEELPSKIGTEVESSLRTISDVLQQSIARSFSPKKHGGGGIDTITISTADKKKKEKKKKKPVHVVHVPAMMMMEKKEKGVQSWVVGEAQEELANGSSSVAVAPRGFLEDAWSLGEKAIDSIAEQAMEVDNTDNGISDKSSVDEQRGKKKKKKKAILKLLLLGAVLKAKIGTLLQILSFKLQVKFLLIALAGLLINVARFWIDVKKQHHQPPQKVIYYEHAQHQHHYDHEEEPGWGGPWSRSIDPEEAQEGETVASPYHAQERYQQAFIRPVPTRI